MLAMSPATPPTIPRPAPSEGDYERIGDAIRFLREHRTRQPELAEVAAHVGLSPYHFQRLFSRWTGVSPKRYLQYLTVEHAKRLLDDSRDLLETTWETGLSGPARLHDHFVTLEAVTPGEYRRGAAGRISWGIQPSPFGPVFLASTERGVCRLAFLGEGEAGERVAELEARWPGSRVERHDAAAREIAARVFGDLPGAGRPLSLLVRGTNFQVQVWKALLEIPAGTVGSYGGVARALGRPEATRAVGNAVGANPVAYLIPCHRVLRSSGEIGGYRWGATRKQAILAWEASRREAAG